MNFNAFVKDHLRSIISQINSLDERMVIIHNLMIDIKEALGQEGEERKETIGDRLEKAMSKRKKK